MDDARGTQYDLQLVKGKTLALTLRPASLPYTYKAITAITQGAPARLTVTDHGLPDDWMVAVVSVKGMHEINAAHSPPWPSDYVTATVVDANTIELNSVNSADFHAYTSGGYLQFFTPVDITGALVRMTIRNQVGGTAAVTLDSSGNGITVNGTTKTIGITVDADTTAALTIANGVYDAEIQYLDGTVEGLLYGAVTVDDEVTT
jgi:hypothetical protein